MQVPRPEPFPFRFLREEVARLAARGLSARLGGGALAFYDAHGAQQVTLRAPSLRAPGCDASDVQAWLEALERPRRQVLLLLQAGAMALGIWQGEDLLAHKCEKKYVVRGRGKAQATYRKTKGKSRYGSRLRLRNHDALLELCCERLRLWWGEYGPVEQIFRSVPIRMWPELHECEPGPPFEQDDERVVKIPLHVHVPCFEELLRVRRALDLAHRIWAPGARPPDEPEVQEPSSEV